MIKVYVCILLAIICIIIIALIVHMLINKKRCYVMNLLIRDLRHRCNQRLLFVNTNPQRTINNSHEEESWYVIIN
jgi:hypothetical protein